VLHKALALPEDDRTAFIRSLIESLEGTAEEGVERAWNEEIAGRNEDLDSGKAKPSRGKRFGRGLPQDSLIASEGSFHEGASAEFEIAFEWYYLRSS
jgi:hypothetical protein